VLLTVGVAHGCVHKELSDNTVQYNTMQYNVHSMDPWDCHKTIGCGTCHKTWKYIKIYSVKSTFTTVV